MTEDDVIAHVFDKEGRETGDQTTKPPIDQPTAPGGIILDTLSEYLGRPATLEELKALTVETSTPIVRWKLAQFAKKHNFMAVAFAPLRLQLIDFSYNSGAELAVRWLQRVLRVRRTGKMDSDTVWAVQQQDSFLVHQAFIAARLQMIDMWTDSEQRRKAWEEGLENRSLSFSLLDVP